MAIEQTPRHLLAIPPVRRPESAGPAPRLPLRTVGPILVGFIVVSVLWGLLVPVLEAPDEPSHVGMVRFLSSHLALPVQQPQRNYFPVGQEGSQPPLYYALGALVWRLAPGPSLAPTWEQHNPYVTFARTRDPRDNRNLYAHTPQEGFPFQGDLLGIHLVRAFGALLGVATVLLTFLIGRELFPDRPFLVLLATALVAFNPQFDFLSGAVNNDNGIAFAATLGLWCLVRWLVRGASNRWVAVTAVALAAAALAKTEGMLLLAGLAVALLADFYEQRRWQLLFRRALLAGAIVGLLAGWWFVRNQVLYGDPLGWTAMLAANAPMIRAQPLALGPALVALWNARGTYWGAFGWTNLFYPDWVYQLLDGLIALAALGLILTLTRRRPPLDRWRLWVAGAWVAVWPLLVGVSLVRWLQVNQAADQWRLLFPAVASIGLLLALGLSELGGWLRRGWERQRGGSKGPSRQVPTLAVSTALAVVGTALSLAVLIGDVLPAYRPTVEAAPSAGGPALYTYGGVIDLVGEQVQPATLRPGQPLVLNLQWRARQVPTRNWTVLVQVQSEDNQWLGQVQSWPQGGRAPTTAWRPGEVYPDRYVLDPTWQGNSPQLARVWVSLYDAARAGGPSLPVTDAQGRDRGHGVIVQQVRLAATSAPPAPSHPLAVGFGPDISLIGYDDRIVNGALHVSLYWRSNAPLADSYTVFVHVLDRSGKQVAQHDGLPNQQRYPTTAWQPGEVVYDDQIVPVGSVPPGTYQIQVGLYQLASGKRLPVHASPDRVVDDALVLANLVVGPR